MRTNDSWPDKATESARLRAETHRRSRVRPDGGETARRLTIDAADGDLAAVVTITGMGHRTSAEIVDDVEDAIRSEMGQLVREQRTDHGSEA